MLSPGEFPHEQYDRIQPLSAAGEALAKELAEREYLRGADVAVSSPFARSISTLRYIIEADSLPFYLDERLREMDFGDMLEVPLGSAEDIRPRQWTDKELAAPGGECVNEVCARMTEALRDISLRFEGKRILVGSHGAAIAAFLSGVLPGVDDDFVKSIGQPDVFVLEYEQGRCVSAVRA